MDWVRVKKDTLEGMDYPLLLLIFLLLGTGMLMVYSSSFMIGIQKFGSSTHFLSRQLVALSLGLLGMVALAFIPYQKIRPLTYPLLLLSLVALILVLIPGVGDKVGGARRWIRWGWFSFQPAETAKLMIPLFLAYSMEKKSECAGEHALFVLPHMLVLGLWVLLLLLEPDLGTSVCLSLVTIILLFVGGARLKHLALWGSGALAFFVLMILVTGYRLTRLQVYFAPFADRQGKGYQIVHSYLALASGGFFGTGLGESKQKLLYLPEPHTDFIFSILGEELGFLGVLGVAILFLLLVWKGFRLAGQAPDLYGSYLALGICLMVGTQAAIHMGVVLGLLPAKGLTLPFISYGGSSLFFTLLAMGVLLNLSRQVKRGSGG
jgi:cell division protein FtsW